MSETRRPLAPVSDNPETGEVLQSALHSLWDVVNQLARVRPRDGRYRVSIFGSARIEPHDPLYEEVKELARRLSALGCDILSGGGPGLMQAANEGAQLGDPHDRTRSVGIRIALPFEQGANPFVEELYTHRTFFTRLHQFIRLSSAYVVVSGGIGTTLETMMVWQLLQVGHVQGVPLVFVGDMWAELVDWARRHMLGGPVQLASPGDLELPICVPTATEAAEVIEQHRARWLASRSQ